MQRCLRAKLYLLPIVPLIIAMCSDVREAFDDPPVAAASRIAPQQ